MSEKKLERRAERMLKNARLVSALLWGGTSLLIALLCITLVSPERFDLRVGDIANKTITASKDVVDEVTTRQRRDVAALQVAAVYKSIKDEDVAGEVQTALQDVFVDLRAVQMQGDTLRAQRDQALREAAQTAAPPVQDAPTDAQDDAPDAQDADTAVINPIATPRPPVQAGSATPEPMTYVDADYKAAAALIRGVQLSNYQLQVLLNATPGDLDRLEQALITGARSALTGTIAEGQIGDAINQIQQMVTYSPSSGMWSVAVPVLRACLKPNMTIDQEATEENREKARAEIEAVVFQQGQNIVVAGERVTTPQLALLNALGLLQGTRFDSELYAGIGLLVALVMAGMWLYLHLYYDEVLRRVSTQLLLLLVVVLSLLLSIALQQLNAYILPVALGALLATILLGTRAAMGVGLTLSLLLGVLVHQGNSTNSAQALTIILMSVLGSLAGIRTVRRRAQRSNVLLAGLYIGATSMVVVFAAGLATNNDLHSVLISSGYAMGSGVLASVLCVGIQPALEALFNLVTPAKLLELSNPNHPLLRRLMIEAPGTYHHSMVVANIAEAAAEAIGANPLMVRVGAYYHDIGKLKRPTYFKENQSGENPHDHTDPRVSTAILVAHVRDGVALGQRHRLPQRVLDMIAQHHGDTPVLFFYHKAAQLMEGKPVDIKDFRYDGPRPQTAEAALLMLADTVEAAVRAMSDATPEKIEQTIRRLVKGKADDGQLDDTPLTFRDVAKICTAFNTLLNGVFHERIEYPTIEIHPVQELPPEVEAFMAEQREAQGDSAPKPAQDSAAPAREQADEA